MKIYSWNVNGIRAVWNKGLLQEFLESHLPDVLCLQETKANQEQTDVELPGYEELWNSAERKGYSGTAIFTQIRPTEIRLGFSKKIQEKYAFPDAFGDPTKEGRVLSAKINGIWVVTVYTPNSKDKLERLSLRHKVWDPAFLDHVKELEAGAPVAFCGDFNVAHQPIDLARPKENEGEHGYTQEERAGFDKMLAAGFVDSFRSLHPDQKDAYTWWTAWGGARQRNVGWRIDYFMVSSSLKSRLKDAQIHPDVMGSDHCPVSIEIV